VNCLHLKIEKALQNKFPGLSVKVLDFRGLDIQPSDSRLEEYKTQVYEEIQEKWTLEDLREHPQFRAYRDFFWKMDIDPTKTRPAAEALIRRILRGNSLFKINTFVDAYNLVSMKCAVPIASFDEYTLNDDLYMREAEPGEEFLGIAMKHPKFLRGGEAVIEDGEQLVAIYPYRDADATKVTLASQDVRMLICGAPNVEDEVLSSASDLAREILTRFCGGEVS